MNHKLVYALLLTPFLMIASPANATEGDHENERHKAAHTKGHHSEKGKGHHGDAKHKAGHKKSHTMSPHWSKTLNERQRVAVDRMHLTLDRELSILKARAELIQKELNVMTARKNVNQNAIHGKIDELMAIKSEIMKQRYDHLSEMRAMLTKQQRLSYDMAILQREGAK